MYSREQFAISSRNVGKEGEQAVAEAWKFFLKKEII
jgi:hypothetical protein